MLPCEVQVWLPPSRTLMPRNCATVTSSSGSTILSWLESLPSASLRSICLALEYTDFFILKLSRRASSAFMTSSIVTPAGRTACWGGRGRGGAPAAVEPPLARRAAAGLGFALCFAVFRQPASAPCSHRRGQIEGQAQVLGRLQPGSHQ